VVHGLAYDAFGTPRPDAIPRLRKRKAPVVSQRYEGKDSALICRLSKPMSQIPNRHDAAHYPISRRWLRSRPGCPTGVFLGALAAMQVGRR